MRKIITFLTLILFVILTIAQPPQKMSYQAVVRDAGNLLVTNQTVGVRISILKSFPNGISVYTETHQVTTNGNGLMSLEIGTGTPTPGSNFATIDWGNDDFYLQSEVDFTGGSNYTIIGTQQLITVPYAFHAGNAAYADSADFNNLANRPIGQQSGDILYWNANTNTWDILPLGQQGQILTVNNGALNWITSTALTSLPPTIRTDTIYNITGRTATVVSTILDPGSTGIIASGVCWSLTPNPSLGNSYTTDGTSIGSFLSQVSGLTSGATFYVRAYATNSIGTSYGAPISFTTPTHCGTVTDYDGNVYNTIYIGAQCWMKENLKTTHYSNGAIITKGQASTTSYYPYAGQKYYYEYGDVPANTPIYGLLYSWAAVMNGAGSSSNNPSGIQGICPSGWHVPSNAEWCELENYIEPGIDVNCNSTGYRGSMAKKLVAPRYWSQYDQNSFAPGYWPNDTTGFNDSGFSGLPGGRYDLHYTYTNTASYVNLNVNGYWWSCTMDNNNYIFYRYLNYQNSGVNLTSIYNTTSTISSHHYAQSVRCVKN